MKYTYAVRLLGRIYQAIDAKVLERYEDEGWEVMSVTQGDRTDDWWVILRKPREVEQSVE